VGKCFSVILTPYIKTIDKTMSHLRGKLIMGDAEMYEGFDPVKQQEHEKYLLDTGVITQQQIDEYWEKARDWKKSNWEQLKKEGEQLNQALANALKKHLKPEDVEVQALVQRHYDLWQYFLDTNP